MRSGEVVQVERKSQGEAVENKKSTKNEWEEAYLQADATWSF